MKKTYLLIVVIAIMTLMGCRNQNGKPSDKTEENTTESEVSSQSVLLEDQPPIRKVQENIGTLKQHQDGYSIGKETEWTKLQKLLSDEGNDLIEINWIWDCGPQYGDMPMKLVYNRTKGQLTRTFTQTNVEETYSGVSPEALRAFLDNNEKDIYAIERYSKDAKYDFNNREMHNTKAGEKPEQDSDGTVKLVADFIKENMSNAKILGWSKVVAYSDYWAVRCEYRAKNISGEYITNNIWFYIQNGQVVALKDNMGNILDI